MLSTGGISLCKMTNWNSCRAARVLL